MTGYREMWSQVDAMAAAAAAIIGRLNEVSWTVATRTDGKVQAKCRKRTGPCAHALVVADSLEQLEMAVNRKREAKR